jgi:hypothetical protein
MTNATAAIFLPEQFATIDKFMRQMAELDIRRSFADPFGKPAADGQAELGVWPLLHVAST